MCISRSSLPLTEEQRIALNSPPRLSKLTTEQLVMLKRSSTEQDVLGLTAEQTASLVGHQKKRPHPPDTFASMTKTVRQNAPEQQSLRLTAAQWSTLVKNLRRRTGDKLITGLTNEQRAALGAPMRLGRLTDAQWAALARHTALTDDVRFQAHMPRVITMRA